MQAMVVAVLSKRMGQFVCFLLLQLLEGTIADARCKLNESQHVLDLLQREHTDCFQIELPLHLLEEILDVPAHEIRLNDLLRIRSLDIREDTDRLEFLVMLVDDEYVLLIGSGNDDLVRAGKEVCNVDLHTRLLVDDVPLRCETNNETEFFFGKVRKELLIIVSTIPDPNPFRTLPLASIEHSA